MLLRALAAFVLTVSMSFAEDTLDDMVKKTDMSSADAVYTLGQWCADHNLPTKAFQYYNQAIKIDKNHEAARAALHQVKVGDRWVAQSQLDKPIGGGKGPSAGSPPPPGHSSGPTAAQIAWDLKVPKDPQPDNTFITDYINRLPTLANDSSPMDNAVATMGTDENLPMAIPRLCAALARPDFNDLYGAASLACELAKSGRIETARPLLGFLAKASERVTDAGDLEMCAFALGAFKDRRAVPRLIELLDSKDENVRDTAAGAICTITAMAPPMSKAKAQDWWDKNHAADPKAVYLEQLKSSDPNAQVDAATALFDLKEKSIFPTLIKLLRVDDRQVNGKAIRLVIRMTGLDFQYLDAKTKEDKDKRIGLVEKWWKDNGDHYQFPVTSKEPDPPANAPPVDDAATWVDDLGSVAGNKAGQAEANLQGKGLPAVPALIGGLENSAPIVRRKCYDLLRSITKQDFKFDAHGEDADRAKAVEAWRAWAREKNLLDPGDAPDPADPPAKDKK